MNKLQKLTRQAYGSTLMDGGYTLWKDEKDKLSGYTVGGVSKEGECSKYATGEFSQLFTEFINRLDMYSDWNGKRSLGIGTWHEDERIYFDVVQLFSCREEAIEACKQRGEKAYFDILEQKSMYIHEITNER